MSTPMLDRKPFGSPPRIPNHCRNKASSVVPTSTSIRSPVVSEFAKATTIPATAMDNSGATSCPGNALHAGRARFTRNEPHS